MSHIAAKVESVILSKDEKACYPFLRRLSDMKVTRKELVSQVIGLAVGSSVNWAQSGCFDVKHQISDTDSIRE